MVTIRLANIGENHTTVELYMGVNPRIGVVNPPKWMVKIMENPIKMDDLGVKKPYFWKPPYEFFEPLDFYRYIFRTSML